MAVTLRWLHVGGRSHDGLVALSGLVLVLDDVLLLELAHALDLVEVDDEALFVTVERLDALAAEDVEVVGAVEVLDALRVLLAELLGQTLLILVLEVEARARQDRVLLDHLVQDVNVEGQPLSTLQLLDQLAADGASDAVLVVQLLDAVRAQSVAAVNQDARDALSHVVLERAELANVKPAGLVVEVHQVDLGHLLVCLAVGDLAVSS